MGKMEMTPGSSRTDASASSFRMASYSARCSGAIWISEIRTIIPGACPPEELGAPIPVAASAEPRSDETVLPRVAWAHADTTRVRNIAATPRMLALDPPVCDLISVPVLRCRANLPTPMELGGRRESSSSAGITTGDDVKPSLDELLLDEEHQ